MARLAPARRVALALLGECRRRDARARDLLRASDAMVGLDPRDRALVTRLVLGTVAARGTLDRFLDAHLSRGHGRLEPRVRDALRMAAFEICYLDTPTSAAVSQGVELVRSVSPRAAGLANAVLRRVAEKDAPMVAAARMRVGAGGVNEAGPGAVGASEREVAVAGACKRELAVTDVALVGGVPEWLAAAAVECGEGAAVARSLEPAPVYVAANVARHTADEAFDLLAMAGLDPRRVMSDGTTSDGTTPDGATSDGTTPDGVVAFELGAPAGLAGSGLVEAVDVLPADLSAQHVATLGVPGAGQRALEVGCGRGTKTVLMAAAMGEGAHLTSCDVDARKVGVARGRVACAGLADRVTCLAWDGTRLAGDDLPEELLGPFDVVLVDAPCSGTGTLRRHPEIAWSLGQKDVAELADLQGRILSAAVARVAPGGRLVYSTCSLLPEEDERVVDVFLGGPAGAGFSLVDQGRLHPDGGRADVHFCAVLVRTGA